MTPLEPGQLWVMRIGAWIACVVALIGAAIGEFVRSKVGIGFVPPGAIIGLIALLSIYPALIAPKKHFHSWGWKVEGEELHLHHGIWMKIETIVPFRRVQHIDVSQGAIERAFHVTSLVLHTAGTLSHKVLLPGLARETAEQIRDQVRAEIAKEADDH